MKKILFLIIGVFLFASVTEKYLDYTNKLVTYNFKLENIDKIKSPFYHPEKITFLNNKKFNRNIKKIVHISLLSIFNNMAYIKVEEFKENALMKSYKKWVKKGDKIEQCRLINIYNDEIVLNCNKKIIKKFLNEKTLKIRIER
jgi:hypothetical protein